MVIAIIAILAALLRPAVNSAITAGIGVHCASNMHQVHLAATQWAIDNHRDEPMSNYDAMADYPWDPCKPVDELVEDGEYLPDASVFFCA